MQNLTNRDAVPHLSVTAVAGSENGLSSDIMYIDSEYCDNNDYSSPYPLEDNSNVDPKPIVEGDKPLKDKYDLPSGEIIKDTEPLSPMSVSPKDITEIPFLMTDLPKNSEEPPVAGSDTKTSKMDSEGQVDDSTPETAPLVDPPKYIGELFPQSMGGPLEYKEEPAMGGIARETKDFKVTDNKCENKSAPPPLSSEEFAPSSLSATLKDDETPPPIPLSEPPDDTDVPPTLPDSEPPEDSDEPPPLPLKDGLSITEKPPLPPKSDHLKCSLSKGVVERPLPISPFSAFDEKNKTANIADSSGAQDDKVEKSQPTVPHSTSTSNRKPNALGGSEPHALDSSHCEVDDKLRGSLPSSLNVSCEKDAAMELVPPPSPARRLSRESEANDTMLIISQPPSMSTSYDGSHECAEHKTLGSVSGGSSSAAVGGSLPSSPSVPRRSHRPHPVPAARSLQTLSTASKFLQTCISTIIIIYNLILTKCCTTLKIHVGLKKKKTRITDL